MPFDLTGVGNLQETISTMRFRNEAHIEIKKEKREIAFTQAIDLYIDSVDFNVYESSKLNPPIQFYGYAVLVFQDALSLEIPIRYPRQRIWEKWQWEALRQWRSRIELVSLITPLISINNNLIELGMVQDLELPALEYFYKEESWIELTLREIHVKTLANTQFTVEYSQYQPIPYFDPITEQQITGKSNQVDGDKDQGLPEDIQPKRNPVDDPFAGNDPISDVADLDQEGFTESGFNNPNPTPLIRVARVIATYQIEAASCQRKQSAYYYQIAENETTFTEEQWQPSSVNCGALQQRTTVRINGRFLDNYIHDAPLFKSILSLVSVPPTETIDI
jgi:hypothetical protein